MNEPVLIYFKLEPYLAEWFIDACGGTNPVRLQRGSSESDILELFLSTGARGRVGEVKPEDSNLAVIVPYFRGKDPQYYNYLPPKARAAFERNIYVRFRVEMWRELHQVRNLSIPITELIYAFLEKHNMSDTPQNWETVRQMYYRKRKLEAEQQRRKGDKQVNEY